MRSSLLIIAFMVAKARADDVSHLSGTVLDRSLDTAVEGALVYVAGPGGLEQVLTTDAHGRYTVALRPGTYQLIFAFGNSRTSAQITLAPGASGVLTGRVDSIGGEVIVIHDRIKPPVEAKPKNFKRDKAPPYSDHAVLSDAWTKAWMLLEVTETGEVTRFKWLKRPGYELEKIAQREVFGLRFDPARDSAGKPIRSLVVWSIEWPSAWWLEQFVGTRTGMPPYEGQPPRRKDWYVPCRGSGPLKLGSFHPVYKDCSKPDLSKATTEPWVAR